MERTELQFIRLVKNFEMKWQLVLARMKNLVTPLRRFLPVLMGVLALTGWVLAGTIWLSNTAPGEPEPQQPAAARQAPVQAAPGGRPYLGIRAEPFKQENLTGLKILEVFPGSPAALSGLRSQSDPLRTTGDVIIRVNDRPIKSDEDFRLLMQNRVAGDVVNFLVTSENAESYDMISVTLGAIPAAMRTANREHGKVNGASQKTDTAAQIEAAILSRVNRLRAERGLAVLEASSLLQKAARSHSEQMASQNFVAHIDPSGKDVVGRIQAQGIGNFKSVGENIFAGENLASVADAVLEGWMASPGHKRNLLSPEYRQAGTGVVIVSGTRKIFVTQVYLEPYADERADASARKRLP